MFCDLGVDIDSAGHLEAEVSSRTGEGAKVLVACKEIWKVFFLIIIVLKDRFHFYVGQPLLPNGTSPSHMIRCNLSVNSFAQ